MTDYQVTKIGYNVPVSCCVLTASTGVNHCRHPAPPPMSKWRRIRFDLAYWWATNRPTIHRGPCNHDDC